MAIAQPHTRYAATSDKVEVIDPTTGVATSLTSIDAAPTRLAVA